MPALLGTASAQTPSKHPSWPPFGLPGFRPPKGIAYNFSGESGGIFLPDLPSFKLTNTFTISTWLYLRSYVNRGPGAQIFFRGDDRCGYDPYRLRIDGDGKVSFQI